MNFFVIRSGKRIPEQKNGSGSYGSVEIRGSPEIRSEIGGSNVHAQKVKKNLGSFQKKKQKECGTKIEKLNSYFAKFFWEKNEKNDLFGLIISEVYIENFLLIKMEEDVSSKGPKF